MSNMFSKGQPLSKIWVQVNDSRWRLEEDRWIRDKGGEVHMHTISAFVEENRLPRSQESIIKALAFADLWLNEIA